VDSRRDGAALPVERAHFVVVNQALGPFYRRVVAALSQRGHRVTVLSGENIDFSEPAVTVIAGPPADRSTIWTRARSWASFLRFAFLNVPKHHDKAVVLSSSNPPLLPHVCAYVGTHHTRHVARVLDVYPDVMRAHPRVDGWPVVQRLWRIGNRYAYRRCACVMTLGEVMASTLSSYTSHRPLVIPDWSTIDPTSVPARDANPMRVELGLGSRLTVLYSGNLGLTHDAGILVKAATQFIDDDNVRFVIVGEGAQHDRLRTDAHARGVERLFVFLPRQTAERLPLSMGLGDFSVVTVARGAETTCMPCKTYDYLAAGSAILAIVQRPSDLASVVDTHRCGVVVAPGDVGALVAAIRDALPQDDRFQKMRAAARRAATEVFSAQIQCARLVELLEAQASLLAAGPVSAHSS